ncbi:hypothetical protein TNCV_1844261 [Trichonephila clavipes]|nr:hypothetical protein TNCV_1844261 [Trichonephila clavipes]
MWMRIGEKENIYKRRPNVRHTSLEIVYEVKCVEGLMYIKFVEAQSPHIGVVLNLESRMPAQVSSSSFDQSSIRRGSSSIAVVFL